MPYQVGTSLGGLVTLESLGIPDPKGFYMPGAEQRALVSGGVRNVGLPRVLWHWGFISQVTYDALREYFTEACDHLFIESRTTEHSDVFSHFEVLSAWPLEPEIEYYRRISFDIKFNVLGEIPIMAASLLGIGDLSAKGRIAQRGLTSLLGVGTTAAVGTVV